MANEKTEATWKAPYVPFRTFTNFLDRFEGGLTLPPRIDRSVLRTLSGAQQTELLGALEALRLIEPETGAVRDDLRNLVKVSAEDRRGAIAGLLRAHYDWAFAISSQNGTQSQLEEAFRQHGVGGSTARKAITFFLHAAKYAEIEVSSNFIAPRAPRRTARRTNAARQPGATREVGGGGGGSTTLTDDDDDGDVALARTLQLGSEGSVTLSVRGNLLAFQRPDRDWVLGVVQKFDDYEATHASGEDDEEE